MEETTRTTTERGHSADEHDGKSGPRASGTRLRTDGGQGAVVRGESRDDGGETEPDGPEAAGVEPLPKDVQYDILKNRRRRLVLQYLFRADPPVSLSTLSEHVAGVENDKPPAQLDSQERKRAYVGLYQCHLPRMDEAGVVEFNKDRGIASLDDHAEELRPYVDPADDEDDRARWATAYLLYAVGGLAVVGAAAATGGLGGLWTVAVAAILVLAGVTAGAQLFAEH